MKAAILEKLTDVRTNRTPLQIVDMPAPDVRPGEILVRISACGVCHTELDEIEGRTPPSQFPCIPGHQIIGDVVDCGPGAGKFKAGDRVGIGWINYACGTCEYCRSGRENLCRDFRATGRDAPGGYAELTTITENFAFAIPERFTDTEAAPLLCAGAIGYRSLSLSGAADGQSIGLTGFGASAHLVLKMIKHVYPQSSVFVFARDDKERIFARDLGAVWAGDIADECPQKLSAIIDTTPAWKPVVEALKNLAPGGRLVINAIRKEDGDRDYLSHLNYARHLWLEKEIKSVTNVTRRDIEEFLILAATIPLIPEVEEYDLAQANQALVELKEGKIRGAKVLKIG